MISFEKILKKFSRLDEYLTIFQKISETPRDEFIQDKILIGGAKYYLQISIESCLDVANHIIASQGLRTPENYADSFKILGENGVIEKELAGNLMQMAKFRNRLVHLYGEIDDRYVYEFLTVNIGDIKRFREIILKKSRPGPNV
jgi:uncharacterized protein YutE (UPF0331/DUF86 family)